MAQNNESRNSRIVNSWSLKAFAHQHGQMKVGKFTNHETKEQFTAPAFVDADNHVCLASFSRGLGVMTPQQISAQADELQIVEREVEGVNHPVYTLCKRGQDSWEDVDLGF